MHSSNLTGQVGSQESSLRELQLRLEAQGELHRAQLEAYRQGQQLADLPLSPVGASQYRHTLD